MKKFKERTAVVTGAASGIGGGNGGTFFGCWYERRFGGH